MYTNLTPEEFRGIEIAVDSITRTGGGRIQATISLQGIDYAQVRFRGGPLGSSTIVEAKQGEVNLAKWPKAAKSELDEFKEDVAEILDKFWDALKKAGVVR